MSKHLLFFTVALLHHLVLIAQVPEPCRTSRKVCPNNNILKNCQQQLAFDEENNTYLLRKDFATPYTGTCLSCYPTNIVEEKMSFVNGKRQGTDTSYYQTGCIQAIQRFELGKEAGATYIFYDSTNLVQFEIWYQNGQFHGPSIQYSAKWPADTLMYKQYKNGKLDGPQRTYFPDGKLRKVSYYKDGVNDGPQLTYNEQGQKESAIQFKNGKKHGSWTYYFDSGKIARSENWKDGKKEGEFVSYNELGQILQTEKFAAGLPVGVHQTYYADGKLNYSCTYSNKGEKIEEYVIDQYGVKKQLFPPINAKE